MSEPNEREDLEQLISHPGWLRFSANYKAEWGAVELVRKMKRAISEATERKEDVAEAVMRVNASHDAVNALMVWPYERAKQLVSQEESKKRELEPQLSRRGNL